TIFTTGIAGFVQQLFGHIRVIGIGLKRLVVVRRIDEAVGARALEVQQLRADCRNVDRILQGNADGGVLDGGATFTAIGEVLTLVEADIDAARTGDRLDLGGTRTIDRVDLVGGHIGDDVDIAGNQLGRTGRGFRNDAP